MSSRENEGRKGATGDEGVVLRLVRDEETRSERRRSQQPPDFEWLMEVEAAEEPAPDPFCRSGT